MMKVPWNLKKILVDNFHMHVIQKNLRISLEGKGHNLSLGKEKMFPQGKVYM
jgi:hypothetical protein